MIVKRIILPFVLLIALCPVLQAEALPVETWLTTSSVELPMAFFDDSEECPVQYYLDNPPVAIDEYWPEAGTVLLANASGEAVFAETNGSVIGFSPVPTAGSETVRLAYAATYMQNPTWQNLSFEVTGNAPFALFVDGEQIASRSEIAEEDADPVTADADLDFGYRRIVLVTTAKADSAFTEWTLGLNVSQAEEADAAYAPTFSTDPRHPYDITDYFLRQGIDTNIITRDGRYLALNVSTWIAEDASREYHLQVWDLREREVIWDYTNSEDYDVWSWSHDGTKLLMTMWTADGYDLYIWHRESLELEMIIDGIDDAYGFTWSPDDRLIYFTKSVPYEEENEYKVMWDLQDRWGGWRDEEDLYYYSIESDAHVRLTSGFWSASDFVISPDGSKIYMVRWIPIDDRPFICPQIWEVSTVSGESQLIYNTSFYSLNHLTISPDGNYLCFDAPINPVLGMDSPYPDNNDNQTDLYILDLRTREAENVTVDFEPAIATFAYSTHNDGVLFWHENGKIGFTGLYNKRVKLYFYNPESGDIEEHDLPTPTGSYFAPSLAANMMVFMGETMAAPGDMYTFDWRRNRGQLLTELHPEFKRLIADPPRSEDYDYVNSDGVTIPGFLFYPRDYDPEGSYPLVIDYYGGVFGFAGGFYWMTNVLANRGYFVYVPTPRGAAGWGQEFADTHPNDWGTLVSRDMNEGVRHIVENVPGVDGDRCAPVSGSYGGFMSMYLLSMDHNHPDYYPYATAISDYGISNLASYWGIGWWGYLYSDMATARTFPWNDPQYYVDHSPLFQADNVTAPLLLIHGESDVNVPVGESDQMYTALRVLNKEVAFVRFPNEGHGVAGDRHHYLTSKRMHIEWFDKYLRDLPGAWDHRMEGEGRTFE